MRGCLLSPPLKWLEKNYIVCTPTRHPSAVRRDKVTVSLYLGHQYKGFRFISKQWDAIKCTWHFNECKSNLLFFLFSFLCAFSSWLQGIKVRTWVWFIYFFPQNNYTWWKGFCSVCKLLLLVVSVFAAARKAPYFNVKGGFFGVGRWRGLINGCFYFQYTHSYMYYSACCCIS